MNDIKKIMENNEIMEINTEDKDILFLKEWVNIKNQADIENDQIYLLKKNIEDLKRKLNEIKQKIQNL